jgi:hypothetical protein
VTVEPYQGTSGSGKAVYGPAATYKGRVESSRRTITTKDGKNVVTVARAFFKPDVSVPEQSRVTCEGLKYLAVTDGKAQGATRPAFLEVGLLSG